MTQGDPSGEGRDPADPTPSSPSSETARRTDATLMSGVRRPAAEDTIAEGRLIAPAGEGYRLVTRIGGGQYGEVWRAIAPGGVEVAVKKILFPMGHKATQVELQALELMKRLRHSYLIQVQAYWIMQQQLLIVMELADCSLDDRAQHWREQGQVGIPRDELLRYLGEAAEAIDFLHGQQVLHRDIKPANILLVQGHVKVADFGLATAGVLGGDQLTTTSATLGTPLYMAPELWQRRAGPRSDQYSLALTYLELRQGYEPRFDERKQIDLASLPVEEQEVLRRALAEDPKDRFESCADFAAALQAIVQRERSAAEAVLRRRRMRLLACVALLLALPAAWLLWQFGLFSPPPAALTAPDRLVIRAGGPPVSLSLAASGRWGSEPLELQVENLPADVTAQWRAIERGAEVTFLASLQAAPRDVTLELVASTGSTTVRRTLALTIQPAEVRLPPGCEPAAGSRLVAVGDGIYHQQVVRRLPDGQQVEFLLIPRQRANDPATFYCLRDKVTNQVFAAFAQAAPEQLSPNSQWAVGARAGDRWLAAADHPRLPVFQVTVEEAHACARWLGGLLPTTRQWDQAAGRWNHPPELRGPYAADWDAQAADAFERIAVHRLAEGPLPAGAAADDISPLGCRDMAGNGREWTRDIHLSQQQVPLAAPGNLDMVLTRGRSYVDERPLDYADLDDEFQTEISNYHAAEADLGFRVVIELPEA